MRASQVLALLERFLREEPAGDVDADRRITIQRSIDPRKILVRIEIGPHGHGKCLWYGKATTALSALEAAIKVAEADPELPRKAAPAEAAR